ncbi:hypothetical protein ACWD4G_36745 [Streptomyces sp. NPDC002643]
MSGMKSGRLGRVALWGFCALVGAWLIAPALIVVPLSFTGEASLVFPPRSWSTRWYANFFTDPDWTNALLNSLQIGLIVTVVATVLAAAGLHCALVPERFARATVRSGRLALAHNRLVPMRQAHYLLRSEDTPQLFPEARAFTQWLIQKDIEDGPLGSP